MPTRCLVGQQARIERSCSLTSNMRLLLRMYHQCLWILSRRRFFLLFVPKSARDVTKCRAQSDFVPLDLLYRHERLYSPHCRIGCPKWRLTVILLRVWPTIMLVLTQVAVKKRDLVIVIGWVLEGYRGDWPNFGPKCF
jgi:hypothetical protein